MAPEEQLQQQMVNLSAQQVQLAASAGVKLLDLPDLQVPLSLAMGQLGILRTLLDAVASGVLIFAAPPKKADTPPPENPPV